MALFHPGDTVAVQVKPDDITEWSYGILRRASYSEDPVVDFEDRSVIVPLDRMREDERDEYDYEMGAPFNHTAPADLPTAA